MNELPPERPGSGFVLNRKRIWIAAAALVLSIAVIVVLLSFLEPTMCGGNDNGIMSNIVNSL